MVKEIVMDSLKRAKAWYLPSSKAVKAQHQTPPGAVTAEKAAF